MIRAWLLRLRYDAIENSIDSALLRRGFHEFQATPRPASVMARAWLLRLSYVAIENIITLIWVDPSYTGLGQSTGEGMTETVIG
jgi:hypothetical protein